MKKEYISPTTNVYHIKPITMLCMSSFDGNTDDTTDDVFSRDRYYYEEEEEW